MLTLGEQGARIGDEHVPAFPARPWTRPARATPSAPRSRSRSRRARRSSRRCAGAAPPARTWSSTKASCPGCRRARELEERLAVTAHDAADRRHRHRRRRRLLAPDRAAAIRGCQLEAITVCCGNVGFEQEVENALYTVERPAAPARCPSTPAAAEPLVVGVGGRRVRPRPGRDGRLVLPAGEAAPRAGARRRRARPPDQREPRRADDPRAGAADEPRRGRHARPVDRAEGRAACT